uniref:Uncharacterized protein n=1 Tax=Glossina brevipalpis TaxID=37001 RepID=A0A1A9WDA3_9MUSC
MKPQQQIGSCVEAVKLGQNDYTATTTATVNINVMWMACDFHSMQSLELDIRCSLACAFPAVD